MEEDQARSDQGSPLGQPQTGHVIRVDGKSHAVIVAYCRWMEDRDGGRVTMAQAVHELLVLKGEEVLREDR